MQLDIPIIGILRGIEAGLFQEVMAASFAAGLQVLEVTMNTPDAVKMVAHNRPRVPTGKMLGMGTIRTVDEARLAIDAGAMFLVTPNFDQEVIRYAAAAKIPVITGALTPTEVHAAWSAGADMVKVFPCGAMGGPRYIRDLRGPFDHIPLVAVGGVSYENLPQYLAAGAKGVGVGASLFGQEALAKKEPLQVEKNVATFIDRCHIGKDVL